MLEGFLGDGIIQGADRVESPKAAKGVGGVFTFEEEFRELCFFTRGLTPFGSRMAFVQEGAGRCTVPIGVVPGQKCHQVQGRQFAEIGVGGRLGPQCR